MSKGRPKLLDLYCGVGSAGTGYDRAGFDVVGVDVLDLERYYPFEFHQASALDWLLRHGETFDAIHASPPCQKYSVTRNAHPDFEYPDLLAETVIRLSEYAVPWVIENVPNSPMRCDLLLCGTMFGLRVKRHRWFQLNWSPDWALPGLCNHRGVHDMYSSGANRNGTEREYCDEMGITWAPVRIGNRRYAATQSIPPAYTEYIGKQLIRIIR